MKYLSLCMLLPALTLGCGNQLPDENADESIANIFGTSSNLAAQGGIYQLQAAFHEAKTNADIDLMMSLWDRNATFINQNDANSPYVGEEEIRAFWSGSGSFLNRRFSLVPSYKIVIDVQRSDRAYLYFECHDVGDYDLATRSIVVDTFLAGTVIKKRDGRWVFKEMTAGRAFPLSYDTYYFEP